MGGCGGRFQKWKAYFGERATREGARGLYKAVTALSCTHYHGTSAASLHGTQTEPSVQENTHGSLRDSCIVDGRLECCEWMHCPNLNRQ